MIDIYSNVFGAALVFCVGAAIAALNYAISKAVIKKHPDKYAVTPVVRQLIHVGFLVAVFFLGEYTPWDRIWLLVGSCLGITLPMAYFTYRLVKVNDQTQGKEEDSDG